MWEKDDLKQLYEAIFHRKSVRSFAAEPLEQEMLDKIMQLTTGLALPLPGAPFAFRLLSSSQIKGNMAKKAHHFLALYTGKEEESIINAAFMMQQMDLWLSAHGIGSCWMGMPKPTAEASRAEGLDFLILLVLGLPTEPLHREHMEEFQRKALTDITDTGGLEQLLTPLRLAPSAINRQPWYITGDKDKLHLHIKQNNLITKAVLGHMPLVDMGIALCHLWLAAMEAGRFSSLEREAEVSSPPGYRYVWTMRLDAIG